MSESNQSIKNESRIDPNEEELREWKEWAESWVYDLEGNENLKED